VSEAEVNLVGRKKQKTSVLHHWEKSKPSHPGRWGGPVVFGIVTVKSKASLKGDWTVESYKNLDWERKRLSPGGHVAIDLGLPGRGSLKKKGKRAGFCISSI